MRPAIDFGNAKTKGCENRRMVILSTFVQKLYSFIHCIIDYTAYISYQNLNKFHFVKLAVTIPGKSNADLCVLSTFDSGFIIKDIESTTYLVR